MARKQTATQANTKSGSDQTNDATQDKSQTAVVSATNDAEQKAVTGDIGAANNDGKDAGVGANGSKADVSLKAGETKAGETAKSKGAAVPKITVICHVKGGRRRAGRRWDEGKNELPATDLSQLQIAQLKSDPRFTVTLTEAE